MSPPRGAHAAEPMHMADVRRLLERGLYEFGLNHVDGAIALWEAVDGIDPGNARATKYLAYARGVRQRVGAVATSPEVSANVEEMVVNQASIESAIEPLRRKMRELFALANFTDTLVVANNILVALPDDVEAEGTRQRAGAALEQMFLSKVAALDEPLEVRLTPEEVVWLNLNSLESDVFARIDGKTLLGTLLPTGDEPRLDTLRFLARLAEDGAIGVPGKRSIRKR